MSKLDLYQELSRLMDGDLPETAKEKLIERLLTDQEAQEIWKRFQAARLALQSRQSNKSSILEEVRKAIAETESQVVNELEKQDNGQPKP